jgi:hypothetical protein
MSENVGASTSRNPKGLHGLYGDNFTFYSILSKLDSFGLNFVNLKCLIKMNGNNINRSGRTQVVPLYLKPTISEEVFRKHE